MDSGNRATVSHTDTTPNHVGRVPASNTTAYTTGVAQGDAPVTTLLQQHHEHETESSVAARQSKVQRGVDEVDEVLAQHHQAPQNSNVHEADAAHSNSTESGADNGSVESDVAHSGSWIEVKVPTEPDVILD